MRRRTLTAAIGGMLTLAVEARAQQVTLPVVGFLHPGSSRSFAPLVTGFLQGLQEAGFTDGRNVTMEYRWAEGEYDRLPTLAADLIRRQVTAIATPGSTPATLAARAVTSTIPIIFAIGSDPVEQGFVTSHARPSGNMTGVSMLAVEITTKRLELLCELVPKAVRIAALRNPISPSADFETKSLNALVRTLGRQIEFLDAGNDREIEAAFSTMVADALLVLPDAFFISRRDHIAALASRKSIPAMYHRHEFVHAGGLASYGDRLVDAYQHVGRYVGMVLRGARPADLPVVQPTRFDLAINLRTAKALGLAVPPAILARADLVLE